MKSLLFSVTKNDFVITTFRGSGPGGQHRNKTDSSVRIYHKESGAVGISESDRSQHTNKKIALRRLAENQKFKNWCNSKAREIIDNETAEEKINRMMSPENIKLEIKDPEGKWMEVKISEKQGEIE